MTSMGIYFVSPGSGGEDLPCHMDWAKLRSVNAFLHSK